MRERLGEIDVSTWASMPTLPGLHAGMTLRGFGGTRPMHEDGGTTSTLPQIALATADGAGARDGEIRLLSTLGTGGMGVVHLAEQHSLSREVAVKVAHLGSESDAQQALLHEARIMGALEHPNVVPIHALGLDEAGRAVLVMKRVQGTTLRALLDDAQHSAWASLLETHGDRTGTFVEVLLQVCDALELAHASGIIHRDIKPDNIMVGSYGAVYLLDWGIAARLPARPGEPNLVGTPQYMAPEMVDGRPELLSELTDVYLLGATLHELLTGAPRHSGRGVLEVLLAAVASEPVAYPPEVPSDLAALCNLATRREPRERLDGVVSFRKRLREHLRHKGSVALARSAEASLSQVEAGLVALLSADAASRLAEARFAFALAKQQWSDNPLVERGARRVLLLDLERELGQKSPAAARALLQQIPDPPPDLEARVADLERLVSDNERRAEGVIALQREMDPSSGAWGFTWIALTILVGGTISWIVYGGTEAVVPTRDVLLGDAFVTSAVVVLVLVFRKHVITNTITGRIAFAVVAQLCAATFAVAVLYRAGVGADVAYAISNVVLSGTFAVIAIMARPWLGLCAAITGVGAAAALTAPSHGELIAGVTNVVLIGTVIALFRSGMLKPRKRDVVAG